MPVRPGFHFENEPNPLGSIDPIDYLRNEFIYNFGFFSSNNLVSSSDDLINSLIKLRPSYCGYHLTRIGSDYNGGYLVPEILDTIDACFSPGVGSVHEFEDHLVDTFSIPTFMCDDSVSEHELNLHSPLLSFSPLRLASSSYQNLISLEQWVKSTSFLHSSSLLLQMDIEGSEYPVLLSCPESVLSQFSIIAIEFHYMEYLINSRFLNTWFNPLFDKLLKIFDCVHFHSNNSAPLLHTHLKERDLKLSFPSTCELTFIRKTLNKPIHPPQIPHPLDTPNDPLQPEHKLAFPWML